MRFHEQRKEALDELSKLLGDIHNYVDVVLVEGLRDVESLRNIGCSAEIEVLSHKGVNDFDLANDLSSRFESILVLTDFDEEGLSLNKRFTSLLEREGVRVESGLRLQVGKLMARIGVYAIEDLDNIKADVG